MTSLSCTPHPQRPLLSKNSKRLLDLVHLLFASLWLGGFIVMFLFSVMNLDASFSAFAIETVKNMVTICIPALMTTGLIYSIFTKWGFRKHGWVVAKWALSIVVIVCSALVPLKPLCLAGVIVGVVALFAISVFKPHKKKRPDARATARK